MKRIILRITTLMIVSGVAWCSSEAQPPAGGSLSRAEAILKQAGPLSLTNLEVGQLKKAEPKLAGTTWIVRSSDGQPDRWQFGEGTLDYQNLKIAKDRGTGSWSLSGDRVTVRSGAATWQGTLKGNRMEGSASNPSQTVKWTWTAEKQ